MPVTLKEVFDCFNLPDQTDAILSDARFLASHKDRKLVQRYLVPANFLIALHPRS
jgi:hypothetical protein